MTFDLQEHIRARAKSIGMLALTRGRDDLVVSRPLSRTVLIDLLVEVVHDRKVSGRVFAVVVQATKRPVKRPDQLRSRLKTLPDAVDDAQMPYCVIAVTDDDEQVYFTWLKKPVEETSGIVLKTLLDAPWKPLDHEAASDIVAAVNAWYDAQRQAQAA